MRAHLASRLQRTSTSPLPCKPPYDTVLFFHLLFQLSLTLSCSIPYSALALGYVYALEIILMILAITFCLPVVLVSRMRSCFNLFSTKYRRPRCTPSDWNQAIWMGRQEERDRASLSRHDQPHPPRSLLPSGVTFDLIETGSSPADTSQLRGC